MRIYKYIILLFLLLTTGKAYSQENHKEIFVDFRVNSAVIDTAYSKNSSRLHEITSFLKEIEEDSTLSIIGISFCGSASPEGSYQLNRKLARARLNAVERAIRNEVEIPDSIITRDDSYISWEYLWEQVEKSELLQKQAVLDIIDEEPHLVDYPGDRHIDHRIVKLQALDSRKVWKELHKLYFERMRNACVVFTYRREIIPVVIKEPVQPVDTIIQKPETDSIIKPADEEPEEWSRKLHLKTNVLGLSLAISNIAVEVDLAKHWSLTVPVYYSALNYFVQTIKFRTLAVQPEIRYWFNSENTKWFIGAHFNYAQYNVAVNGDYRYQDHDGKSPAIGGGISGGYRMPISKDRKWHVEFALGAGAFPLHYDRFINTPGTKDGLLLDTNRFTYWGIDHASVSFSYSFDLKKKKGGEK